MAKKCNNDNVFDVTSCGIVQPSRIWRDSYSALPRTSYQHFNQRFFRIAHLDSTFNIVDKILDEIVAQKCSINPKNASINTD